MDQHLLLVLIDISSMSSFQPDVKSKLARRVAQASHWSILPRKMNSVNVSDDSSFGWNIKIIMLLYYSYGAFFICPLY